MDEIYSLHGMFIYHASACVAYVVCTVCVCICICMYVRIFLIQTMALFNFIGECACDSELSFEDEAELSSPNITQGSAHNRPVLTCSCLAASRYADSICWHIYQSSMGALTVASPS